MTSESSPKLAISAVRVPLLCLSIVLVTAPLLAGETGSITGSLENEATIVSVTAVDRATGKRFTGKVDADRFRIESLPLGATFDVILDFKPALPAAGAPSRSPSVCRLEGVNMKVPRSDYEEEQPLSPEDIATIKEKVLGLNQFEDVVEILAIHGNIQHAAVLVNKLRTKPFY